jgi:hypothetical protein
MEDLQLCGGDCGVAHPDDVAFPQESQRGLNSFRNLLISSRHLVSIQSHSVVEIATGT